MRINLSIRQLEGFVCVAQCGSFTAAAGILHVTQSSLSRTVQQLESLIGARLFDRNTRTVVLSSEGAEFLAVASHTLDSLDRGLKNFGQFVAGKRGQVTIATLPSMAVSVLAPIIAGFHQRQPEVEVFIRDGIAGGVYEALRQSKADFGLTFLSEADPEIVFEPLLCDRFFVLCRKDHPLARRTAVRWRDLETYPFLGSAPSSSVRHFTDAAFRQAGVEIRHLYEPTGLPPLASLVAQGLGVTALPGLVLPIVAFANLVHRPLVEPALERQVGVLTVAGRPQSPAAQAFLAFLREEIRAGGVVNQYCRPLAAGSVAAVRARRRARGK